ncbi:hypothetical protein OROMI_011464 [Orobanche minor]
MLISLLLWSYQLELSTHTTPDPNTRVVFPTGKNFIFSQFSSFLPKLDSLVLTVHIFEDVRDFTQLCVFSNLKHLSNAPKKGAKSAAKKKVEKVVNPLFEKVVNPLVRYYYYFYIYTLVLIFCNAPQLLDHFLD